MSVLSAPQTSTGRRRQQVRQPGFLTRCCRALLTRQLERLRAGTLRLVDLNGSRQFGGGGPAAAIEVHDEGFYRLAVLQGTLGAAEAYLNGWWSSADLVGLFRLLTRNAEALAGLDRGPASLARRLAAWAHWLRPNSLRGSRRNIAAHYDLGNDFYALFLDETMTYSAALFPRPEASLAEASRAKYEQVCRKLDLSPRDQVLEIGGGWGGFAAHAAREYGCRVTTTTISKQQYEYARARIQREELADRVTVLGADYRSLTGQFDKLVSIEMIEAVGHHYLETFFGQCGRLLKRDGLMLLQCITIPDQRYEAYRRSADFIQRYVFPGGCLPSLGAIARAVQRASDLRLIHLEDFASHYAETLARWRRRFWANIDQVRALGFDDRFIRLWHYYLCYCEAGFLERQTGVAQLLLARPACQRAPLLWRPA